MHLKSILNHVHPLKSFVYKRARLVKAAGRPAKIEVEIEPRTNGRPICSGCGEKRPGYDRLPVRRFQFVPLWGMPVFLVYAMRRVKCPPCGVTVEQVPWATGEEVVRFTSSGDYQSRNSPTDSAEEAFRIPGKPRQRLLWAAFGVRGGGAEEDSRRVAEPDRAAQCLQDRRRRAGHGSRGVGLQPSKDVTRETCPRGAR